MKHRTISPLFFIFILVLGTIFPIYAQESLSIIVTTDKQTYYPRETVLIYGNLTFNETLVTDGLVGIQVQDPENRLLTIRTVTTGTIPSITPFVKVKSLIPCNSEGDPQENFTRGTLAYFQVTVRNYDIQPRLALTTVNIYDLNNVSLCSGSLKATIPGQTTSIITISIPIPTDAATGNATAYANAYTDWPQLEGTPYCPEVPATFKIINGEPSQSEPPTTPQVNGNYNLTFQLAQRARPGIYTIYATSHTQGKDCATSETFKVNLLGDFTGSGYPPPTPPDDKININDIRYFIDAYKSQYGISPPYPIDPTLCDLTGPGYPPNTPPDGKIDINDIRYFIYLYVDYWS